MRLMRAVGNRVLTGDGSTADEAAPSRCGGLDVIVPPA
jgi:hypothetical protein